MTQQEYANFIVDTLTDFGSVTTRAMFGGIALYKDGLIFGIVVRDTLYFKVDSLTRPEYEAHGSTPFTYQFKEKTGTMSYWEVPLGIIDDSEQLAQLAETAYLASARSKTTPKKR
jgi:DNA transformation protein